MTALTQEYIKSILHYEPSDGMFTWLVPCAFRVKVGDIAGTLHNGYVDISIKNKKYFAHRLAWLYVYGEWPSKEIDHINGIPHDNRLINLRHVGRKENNQNHRKARVNSASGILGVYPRSKKFFSSIRANGKSIHLGSFPTAELAHSAYVDAKRKFHEGCTL